MALNQNDFPKIEKYINLKKFEVIKKGTLVITHENGFVTSIIFYKVPLEVLWNRILDFDSYSEYTPHIKSAKVKEKEGDTWVVDYKLVFDFSLISIDFGFSLKFFINEKEKEIYGFPLKGKVGFRMKFLETDGGVILIYTGFADLKSFGILAKFIFRLFPEVETPLLVGVMTVFPEGIKEKLEGLKLIGTPDFGESDVDIPERLKKEEISEISNLAGVSKSIVLAHYPDGGVARFATGFAFLKREKDFIWRAITDFGSYKKVTGLIYKVRVVEPSPGKDYTVDFGLRYKAGPLSLKVNFSLDFNWDGEEKLIFVMNRERDNDFDGAWGSWDVYTYSNGSVLAYTTFADLGTANFILRLMLRSVKGSELGINIGTVSMMMDSFEKWLK